MMFLSGVSRELDGIVEYNPNRQHDACCTEDQLAGTTVAGHGFSLQPSGTTLQQYIQKPSSERIHQIWGGPAQTVEESPVRACIWRIMKSTICLSCWCTGTFPNLLLFWSDLLHLVRNWWAGNYSSSVSSTWIYVLFICLPSGRGPRDDCWSFELYSR